MLAALSSIFAACNAVTGIGSYQVSEDDAGDAGDPGRTACCQTCLLSECLGPTTACTKLQVCQDRIACLGGCGPDADVCVQDCVKATPSTVADDLMFCVLRKCSAQCVDNKQGENCPPLPDARSEAHETDASEAGETSGGDAIDASCVDAAVCDGG